MSSRIPMEMLRDHLVAKPIQSAWKRYTVRIWSAEHGMWWRPNRSGYTSDIKRAGLYPFKDALASTDHCGREKAIQFERVTWRELLEAALDGMLGRRK